MLSLTLLALFLLPDKSLAAIGSDSEGAGLESDEPAREACAPDISGLLFASPQKYNWNDAKTFCRTKSGILALGNDAATWNAILNNFDEDVYVGLSNPDGESCKNGACKNKLSW